MPRRAFTLDCSDSLPTPDSLETTPGADRDGDGNMYNGYWFTFKREDLEWAENPVSKVTKVTEGKSKDMSNDEVFDHILSFYRGPVIPDTDLITLRKNSLWLSSARSVERLTISKTPNYSDIDTQFAFECAEIKPGLATLNILFLRNRSYELGKDDSMATFLWQHAKIRAGEPLSKEGQFIGESVYQEARGARLGLEPATLSLMQPLLLGPELLRTNLRYS
ncbi:uncharacterized protein MKK02DRAFT_40504 [Dioszegia hungarica]|uniref:Uncharacterized protein n=1 Tax=Dioszegia hungarica TaxID=4972 RepID=A0AA38LS55_9TREE|nr:uncharacterized protein MKK02DRAFT_40504 [Dioszegia hungarica]KAI9632204.1 hypothetical protein MKK02DRAFT_40504 [Dioszegia hungarica]